MALPGITRAEVRRAIIDYLTRHPRASDSLRGVVEWCYMALGTRPGEVLVQEVLDELLASGEISSVKLADGTRIYGAPSAH